MKKHADELKAQGYRIDDTCYPWLAYRGERFGGSDDYYYCYTTLESQLVRGQPRWEHRTVATKDIKYQSVVDVANELGKEGWQLVQVREMAFNFVLLLKRPIHE